MTMIEPRVGYYFDNSQEMEKLILAMTDGRNASWDYLVQAVTDAHPSCYFGITITRNSNVRPDMRSMTLKQYGLASTQADLSVMKMTSNSDDKKAAPKERFIVEINNGQASSAVQNVLDKTGIMIQLQKDVPLALQIPQCIPIVPRFDQIKQEPVVKELFVPSFMRDEVLSDFRPGPRLMGNKGIGYGSPREEPDDTERNIWDKPVPDFSMYTRSEDFQQMDDILLIASNERLSREVISAAAAFYLSHHCKNGEFTTADWEELVLGRTNSGKGISSLSKLVRNKLVIRSRDACTFKDFPKGMTRGMYYQAIMQMRGLDSKQKKIFLNNTEDTYQDDVNAFRAIKKRVSFTYDNPIPDYTWGTERDKDITGINGGHEHYNVMMGAFYLKQNHIPVTSESLVKVVKGVNDRDMIASSLAKLMKEDFLVYTGEMVDRKKELDINRVPVSMAEYYKANVTSLMGISDAAKDEFSSKQTASRVLVA